MPPRSRTSTTRKSTRKAAPRKKATTSATKAPTKQPSPATAVGPGEHAWLVDVPYEARSLASSAGAKWWAGYGWVYIGTSLPPILKHWTPARYSWSEFVQRTILNPGSTPGSAEPDHGTGTFTLRPDQEEDVQAILDAHAATSPEFLLGSLVGTGKTPVAIAAVKRMPGVRRVLIVCPLSVAPGWRRTIADMGDGGKEWAIINYESTKKLLEAPASAATAKKASTKNRRITEQGTPKVPWDVVITDEAHYLGNPLSQQFRVVDRVIEGPAGTPPAFALRMSATAGSNPAQLSYLHRGLLWRSGETPMSSISAEQFVQWCTDRGINIGMSRFGNGLAWDAKGNPAAEESDLRKMRHLLFGGRPVWALRRAPDWPDQQRILTPVEFDQSEWSAYQAEWSTFESTMRALASARTKAAHLAEVGTPAQKKKAAKEAAQLRVKGLAALTQYRQKAGLIRAPGTADFIANMVAKGVQVAVSCEYLGTVTALHDSLTKKGIPVAVFTGQNPQEREAERIAYQRGEKTVILFTPAEGFNLHAGEVAVGGNTVPRVTVVAEPRWAPKKALQIEGRSQRDGTVAPCYYCYATGTVEEKVLRTVIGGMKSTLSLMGDDTSPIQDLSAALGVPLIGF